MANFAPRVGINWDPTKSGKMSVRAGYGIFYDQTRLIGYNRFSTAEPYAAVIRIFDTGPSSLHSGNPGFLPLLTGNTVYTQTGTANPFPFQLPRTPSQRSTFNSTTYGGNWPSQSVEVGLAPNFNEGYTQNWNLTVQRELAHDVSLSVGYVGNRANHLWIAHESNFAASPNGPRLRDSIQCGTAIVGVTKPCYGPFEEESSAGWSTYNSLQVTLNKRFQRGLTFNASYVYGKYLDIASFGAEGRNGPRDPYDWGLDYGPSDDDVRHRVVVTALWQLPEAKALHGFASAILNHWQTNLIAIAQTGTPFGVYSGSDTAGLYIGGDTADPVPGTSPNVGHRYFNSLDGHYYYLNTAAFQNAAAGTFGQIGRNAFYGPGYVNFDFSLFKEFPISESQKVQFRSEVFNLFNHPNFFNPNDNVNGGLGQINSANNPRYVQFALKYLF